MQETTRETSGYRKRDARNNKEVRETGKIKQIAKSAKEWIKLNVSPTVALSVMALLISIASATLSISRLIQYLITH